MKDRKMETCETISNDEFVALQYLAERRQNLNQFLDTVMGLCLPDDYAERSCINEEELNEMASLNKVQQPPLNNCPPIKNNLDGPLSQ